jgi:hypothetical protein
MAARICAAGSVGGVLLALVRFGIPAVLALAGVLFLAFGDEDTRYDMFGMCLGAALALLFFTFLFRMGVQGEKERAQEEEARRFLVEHGHWPDEPPRRPR